MFMKKNSEKKKEVNDKEKNYPENIILQKNGEDFCTFLVVSAYLSLLAPLLL